MMNVCCGVRGKYDISSNQVVEEDQDLLFSYSCTLCFWCFCLPSVLTNRLDKISLSHSLFSSLAVAVEMLGLDSSRWRWLVQAASCCWSMSSLLGGVSVGHALPHPPRWTCRRSGTCCGKRRSVLDNRTGDVISVTSESSTSFWPSHLVLCCLKPWKWFLQNSLVSFTRGEISPKQWKLIYEELYAIFIHLDAVQLMAVGVVHLFSVFFIGKIYPTYFAS